MVIDAPSSSCVPPAVYAQRYSPSLFKERTKISFPPFEVISPPPKFIVPSKYPVIYISASPPESIWTLCADSSPEPPEPKDTKNTADILLDDPEEVLHCCFCGIVKYGLLDEFPAASYAIT